MSFPTDFPQASLGVVVNQIRNKTLNAPQLALALYEIEGYALYQVFGDVKAMTGALPNIDWAKVTELLQDPDLLKYADALKDAVALFAGGMPVWRIALRIAINYGPAALAFVKKVISVIEK